MSLAKIDPPAPPLLLSPQQASAYIALSPSTLARFRVDGTGPAYIKVGPGKRARVRYRLVDLDAWLAANRFTSTSNREVMS